MDTKRMRKAQQIDQLEKVNRSEKFKIPNLEEMEETILDNTYSDPDGMDKEKIKDTKMAYLIF